MKKDLSRTKLAESACEAARAEKNRQLQHGGVMNVDDARAKIQKKRVNEVEKAEAVIEAYEKKQKRLRKKVGREAARAAKAREKRLRKGKEG